MGVHLISQLLHIARYRRLLEELPVSRTASTYVEVLCFLIPASTHFPLGNDIPPAHILFHDNGIPPAHTIYCLVQDALGCKSPISDVYCLKG